jgi:predicted metal-dependent hydrolase
MPAQPTLIPYLSGYPAHLLEQVQARMQDGTLGALLRQRYPTLHEVRNERSLQDYVLSLKNQYLRSTPPLSRVSYDNQIHVIRNALGTHTTISRVQGSRLKSKREIRIASVFREMPEAFLKMIVVHELAHLKIREHDKAFYQLCCHMEPDYYQFEFDLRVSLYWMKTTGKPLWGAAPGLPSPDEDT